DKVISSVDINSLWDYVEHVTLTGKALVATGNIHNNVMIGNASANTLSGLDGDDIIDGLGGNDRYVGGDGEDTFRLSAAPNAKKNVKTIEDFVSGEDTLEISVSAFKWKNA